MKNIRLSTYLNLLAVVLLCLGFGMAFFVYQTVENLKHDAKIINRTGVIRGSIQRFTKLELYEPESSNEKLMEKIDQLIENFMLMEEGYQHKGTEKELINSILELKGEWQHLKGLLIEYRQYPSDYTRKQIIVSSESCWDTADAAVLTAQLATEGKVLGIRLFYYILVISALNTLLVIWLVYFYVRKKLEYQASYDSLTDLLNRHSYENEIEKEFIRCRRYDRTMSLILLDIDHFKKINDRYGHKTGDQILRDFADLLKKIGRKSDSIFRIGGEEFAIIVPETAKEKAFEMAEKICKRVENHSFETVEQVTVSLGVSDLDQNETQTDLYRQADSALYKAKGNGRNQAKMFQL